jgi:hypothetical protein
VESLATSVLTKLRKTGLNCAPGCESLLAMYSIFGPTNLFEPIPPKVIHRFGLYISIIRPTLPVTLGFQLNIEGCSATIKSKRWRSNLRQNTAGPFGQFKTMHLRPFVVRQPTT